MGCNQSKVPSNPSDISLNLVSLIDQNDSKALMRNTEMISSLSPDLRFCVNSLSVNLLGYSLSKGKIECFKVLLQYLPESLEQMEEILNSQGFRSIDLVCMQGSIPMLNFYLPIYELNFIKKAKPALKDPSQSAPIKPIPKTPVQYACFYGHFNIIRVIKKYYSASQAPCLFDLNSPDQVYGENCALMSCRLGCYKLMRFLFEECGANFFCLNNRGENALFILSAGSKKICNSEFILCFKYLLNVIKIDPRHKYEEIVLILDSFSMLDIYYEALKPYGLCPDKKLLERINEFKALEREEAFGLEEFYIAGSNRTSFLSSG